MSENSFVSRVFKPDMKLLLLIFLVTFILWNFNGDKEATRPVLRKKPDNVLDFGMIREGCYNDDPLLYRMGAIGFNHSPELLSAVAYLKHVHGLTAAVETGTFQGNTTSALSLLFDTVHSIEVVQGSYDYSQEHLRERKHVHLHLGDSAQKLPEILEQLQGHSLFLYLDAHWGSHWPILDELNAIAQTHKDRCVIVVDDVLVPGYEDMGYDSFEDKPLSYDFVKESVAQVFTQHEVLYLVPHKRSGRGKMVLMPKRTQNEQLG